MIPSLQQTCWGSAGALCMHWIQTVPWNSEPLCCCSWIRADGHCGSIHAALELGTALILCLLVLPDQELVSLKQCWLVQMWAMLRPGSGWCKAGTVLNKQGFVIWEEKATALRQQYHYCRGAQGWGVIKDKVAETWKNMQRDPCLPSWIWTQ